MVERHLSSMQAMLQRHTSPALFAAMQRESRLWKAECPNCGAQPSIWDIGGVRYKALGQPKKRLLCPECSKTGWMRIRWTGGDPTALGPRPPVTPLVLKTLLVLLLPLLLIGAIAAVLIALF